MDKNKVSEFAEKVEDGGIGLVIKIVDKTKEERILNGSWLFDKEYVDDCDTDHAVEHCASIMVRGIEKTLWVLLGHSDWKDVNLEGKKEEDDG